MITYLLPNRSSSSEIPHPVKYWISSIATDNSSAAIHTLFFRKIAYRPVPKGMNSQTLLTTSTLIFQSVRKVSAQENSIRFARLSPVSQNIRFSQKIKIMYASSITFFCFRGNRKKRMQSRTPATTTMKGQPVRRLSTHHLILSFRLRYSEISPTYWIPYLPFFQRYQIT